MSDPRKELQEVRGALLNITEDIGRSFASVDRRLQQLLQKLYEINQEMAKRNELAALQGEAHAVPTRRFQDALGKLNQEALARNEEIKQAQLRLRQLHENSPATPADALQAKALESKLNELNNQNAQLLNIQKALLDATFVTGRTDADKELSRQTLSNIQDQIGTGLNQNKVLKSELQAERLATLGITMKTGLSPAESKTVQPAPEKPKSPGIK